MQRSEWVKVGRNYNKNMPKLTFPLEGALPKIYVPERTVLLIAGASKTIAWLWCYLEREKQVGKYRFNPSSLSERRVNDLPTAIERLSRRYRFDNTKPRTMDTELRYLSSFLFWLDDPRNQRRYESILSAPDLALQALKHYHTHLRQRMQANHTGHSLSAAAAFNAEFAVVKLMSVIHDREYDNEIEIIQYAHSDGVKAPKTEDVATFMACVEGVFDSVTRIVLEGPQDTSGESSLGELRWQSGRQICSATIPSGTPIERVMELGCMAYAALCIGDSGSNLAQIQNCEEPENLNEQLRRPEKLNLRQKVIKLRAGGRVVPLHLTATTVTRLEVYFRLREALRLRLDCQDIGPMFVQCKYIGDIKPVPFEIIPLTFQFTAALRSRFNAIGINLPLVTMRQLRAYKEGSVSKKYNPELVAEMMGHSVATAIRRYKKITEIERQTEISPFMARLESVVLARAKEDRKDSKSTIPLTEIPPGNCEDHGHPKILEANPLVKPDCKKTEGCFFCDNFHVHDDEKDATKLMSCRYVLDRLSSGPGDSVAAENVYDAVLSRIKALLNEIKQRNEEAHERARQVVEEEGHLNPYWASKLQQLNKLGLILPTAPGSDRQMPSTHSA